MTRSPRRRRFRMTRLHASAQAARPSLRPPAARRIDVALVPDLASLRPGLEFTSRGRFRGDVAPREADVLMVTPCSPGTLHGLRQRLRPGADLVVLDRRAACAPQLIADMIEGGATTVVTSASSTVLAAHLDALVRRRQSSPRQVRTTCKSPPGRESVPSNGDTVGT
jgi:hypothetical protein